jgi:hypothetical protein
MAFDVATGRGDHPGRTALKADMVTRWKRPNRLIHALCGQGLPSCWESGLGLGSVFHHQNGRAQKISGPFFLHRFIANQSERSGIKRYLSIVSSCLTVSQ